MDKLLFDMMPALELPADLKSRLNDAVVRRVAMSHERNTVKIHLELGAIISRREQSYLEGCIKSAYFKYDNAVVRVLPFFHLDSVTAEEILDSYGESISQELKEKDLLLYSYYDSADISAAAGTVSIAFTSASAGKTEGDSLKEFLENLISERFGIKVGVDVKLAAASSRPQKERIPQSEKFKYKKKMKKLVASQGYGYEFSGDPIPICNITEEMGSVVIRGKIFSSDERTLSNGMTLVVFGIYDGTDSIQAKVFAVEDQLAQIRELVAKKPYVTLFGEAVYDKFAGEIIINRIKGIKYTEQTGAIGRTDDEPEKRVELHLHTKMSEMDAVTDVGTLIERAASFGHKAMAITDHGVVYSFPDAMKAADALEKKGRPIKIIYGCEGYLVADKEDDTIDDILKAPRYHIILLAKNETGRVNLYRLVSESHIKYFNKRPRIPRSVLQQYREGILVGSACEAGELVRSIVTGAPDEEIEKIASFYDYLEIQPIGNNEFLKRSEAFPDVKTDEDLRDINRRVVALGEKLGKPVAATCDVHFMDPQDEIYRRIIMKGMGYGDADFQPPLYFRTTREMLDEFAYLGEEKAREVVITNTNLIADMCEVIRPVRPDKCPPSIAGSEEKLRDICYARAHEIYGDPLPDELQTRLDKELGSIISNGYSVMYVFAQMLVKKSNDDGYMVGSRGSVGSSLVARMMDITEVNPLPPHYVCPKCKHSEFDSKEIRAAAGKTGYDLPDKVCPKCGAMLGKDGVDIPFETFLGFKGNKEPDIDLNFSGEYQSKAHNYTIDLFGRDYTFRAGTISTVKDKTAYGFVKKYFEEKGEQKRRCEIDRLISGCVGIRRSTGQHPGGIIVVPQGESIYSFTPIQRPANDTKTDTITTHFEYHAIEQNLLKFDILGHDDPTMLKWLGDLSGVDPRSIKLDDPKLYSLFESTEALGITPADIGGAKLGTYGIPEFNTDFAMEMLIEAKPHNFADLVNVSGLAHGTAVWMDNARDLIKDGTATLQTAICTRDGIMLYLISKGLEPAEAFSIMECVRKGKVAKKKAPEWDGWKEDMKKHGVPDWYIKSCEKIEYMFPKAHAAAYVMMALRVAYYKIYHPLEFYAAYFGIRAKAFDVEKMAMGREKMEETLANFRKYGDGTGDAKVAKDERLTDIEKDTFRDLRMCEEMYARGYEFMPIDIYRADAVRFQVIDGKIMPSFSGIAGMGDKAARSLQEEAAKARFLSKEDLISRTKISTTLADTMERLGLLGDMPETNQLSIFDIELE